MSPTQIDSGAVIAIDVAPDEAHALIQRTSVTDPSGLYTTGALAVVTVDSAGAGSTRELTTAVYADNDIPVAGFSADSKSLFYADLGQSPMALMAAAADGSSPRKIATGIIQISVLQGTTLVYAVDPTSTGNSFETWAVALPSGAPVMLEPATLDPPTIDVNATGTAMVYVDNPNSFTAELVQTSGSGSPATLSTSAWIWAPDGGHLAYWLQTTWALSVVDASGANDTMLLPSGLGVFPVWSHDGKKLAYGVADASGLGVHTAVVHTFGGADVTLTSTADLSSSRLWLNADGSILFAEAAGGEALIAAPTGQAGSFTTLVPDLQLTAFTPDLSPRSFDVAPANDFVAAVEATSQSIAVVPAGGGAAVTPAIKSVYTPFYEPVGTHGQLLAFVDGALPESGIPGTVALFAKDGSGGPIALPGAVLPAETLGQEIHDRTIGWQTAQVENAPFTWGWLGHSAVWAAEGMTQAFDLVAASDDGATVGLIAPGAVVWTVRGSATPTRVFFGRPGQTGGLWWSPIP